MKNRVLLLGKLEEAIEALSDQVRAAGLDPVVAPLAREAFEVLADDTLCAVVYEAGAAPVESLVTTVRGNPRFDEVALIAFVRETGVHALGPVFATGADDYLPVEEIGHLEEKLRELTAHAVTGHPLFIMGRAILADTDRQWRVQSARVLRQAGYDVHFAVDADEIERVLECDSSVQLVVADVALPPSGSLSVLEALRRRGRGGVVWIGSCAADQRVAIERSLAAAGCAAVHDRGTPPENLMFIINATTMTPGRSQRASERLLYSTPVSFEVAGRPGVVWGSTYNLSRVGLYIRTLTPAPYGAEIALHLEAPADGPLVEVQARVVWRKEFRAQGGVPGPTGMGVQILGAEGTGAADFAAGYDRLAARSQAAGFAAGHDGLAARPRRAGMAA
jgi:CheY-like chemotaxis protein